MHNGGYSNLRARGKNFQELMLSEKKKRSDLGLHIFLRKSKCFPKKKKKGLPLNFISDFPIFHPKSRCSPKKKGLHSESSSDQTFAANPKQYVLFSRGGPQKKGGLRRLPHSPHPISTTVHAHRISPPQKKFFNHCNETTLLHYFKKEHLRKTILLYMIVTVSHGTYLGIDQSMKRKFVSSTANTCKSHMFDTDFVICSCFFCIFWPGPISLS